MAGYLSSYLLNKLHNTEREHVDWLGSVLWEVSNFAKNVMPQYLCGIYRHFSKFST